MCFHSAKLCAYIAPNLFLPAVNGYRRSFGRIHLTVQQNLQFLNSKPRPNSIWVEIKEQPKKAFHQLQGDWQKSWQRFFTQNSLNFFRVTPWNLHPTIPAFHQVSNFLKNVILKQQTLQTTFPVPLFFFGGPIIQFTGTKKNNSPLSQCGRLAPLQSYLKVLVTEISE